MIFKALILFSSLIMVTPKDAQQIGEKIWQNECAGTIEGLTHWNAGEEFGSFGIGHFIWYPNEKKGPFEETFPQLLKFLGESGIDFPNWLKDAKQCPWNSRQEFFSQFQEAKLRTLREFLQKTVALQALFIAKRLEDTVEQLIPHTPSDQRPQLLKTFTLLASDPQGLYALIDYLNFKGSGISPLETYHGEGWGLLQVLQKMPPNPKGCGLEEFIGAAKFLLQQRVANSPPERNEARWLPGWIHRVSSYTGD